jgi:UDP-N-acetyl-D-mannosaminuronate dehydrogenase
MSPPSHNPLQTNKDREHASPLDTQHLRIAVVGLGYVGLPLAVEFGKRYATVGYDINAARIAELRAGRDSTLEVEPELLAQARQLSFSSELDGIAGCNVYIVTVPTPIDSARRPDLTPLRRPARRWARCSSKGMWWCMKAPSTPAAPRKCACRSWSRYPA